MALVLTVKTNEIIKIGDSYVAYKLDNGNVKIIIDAPCSEEILRPDLLKDKLVSNGWKAQPMHFTASHPVHGTTHIRNAERIIDGGNEMDALRVQRAGEA